MSTGDSGGISKALTMPDYYATLLGTQSQLEKQISAFDVHPTVNPNPVIPEVITQKESKIPAQFTYQGNLDSILYESIPFYTQENVSVNFNTIDHEIARQVDIPVSHFPDYIVDSPEYSNLRCKVEDAMFKREFFHPSPEEDHLSGRGICAIMAQKYMPEESKLSVSGFTPSNEASRKSHNFFVRVDSVDFTALPLKNYEPVYLTFALYSLETATKLSEDVSVDLNSPTIMRGHMQIRPELNIARLSQMQFEIEPAKQPDVYLVIRVAKTFSGSQGDRGKDDFTKASSKSETMRRAEANPNSSDPGTAAEVQKKQSQNAARVNALGTFHEIFAFGAIPIVKSGRFTTTEGLRPAQPDEIVPVKITQLFWVRDLWTPEQFIEALRATYVQKKNNYTPVPVDMQLSCMCLLNTRAGSVVTTQLMKVPAPPQPRKAADDDASPPSLDEPDGKKKKKKKKTSGNSEQTITCEKDYKVSMPESDFHLETDSRYLQIHSELSGDDKPFVRLIQSFEPPLLPLTQNSFAHYLYITPTELDFRNKVIKESSQNLVVEMKVMDDDISPNKPGIRCIQTPFSYRSDFSYLNAPTPYQNEQGFVDSVVTTVFYHDYNPHFCEQFKIVLPLHLGPKIHILFTIYHVAVKNFKMELKKPYDPSVETRTPQTNAAGIEAMLSNGKLNKLGYVVIPLKSIHDIRHMAHTHPIISQLEGGYIGYLQSKQNLVYLEGLQQAKDKKSVPQPPPGVKVGAYIANGKHLFSIESKFVSTLVPANDFVRDALESVREEEAKILREDVDNKTAFVQGKDFKKNPTAAQNTLSVLLREGDNMQPLSTDSILNLPPMSMSSSSSSSANLTTRRNETTIPTVKDFAIYFPQLSTSLFRRMIKFPSHLKLTAFSDFVVLLNTVSSKISAKNTKFQIAVQYVERKLDPLRLTKAYFDKELEARAKSSSTTPAEDSAVVAALPLPPVEEQLHFTILRTWSRVLLECFYLLLEGDMERMIRQRQALEQDIDMRVNAKKLGHYWLERTLNSENYKSTDPALPPEFDVAKPAISVATVANLATLRGTLPRSAPATPLNPQNTMTTTLTTTSVAASPATTSVPTTTAITSPETSPAASPTSPPTAPSTSASSSEPPPSDGSSSSTDGSSPSTDSSSSSTEKESTETPSDESSSTSASPSEGTPADSSSSLAGSPPDASPAPTASPPASSPGPSPSPTLSSSLSVADLSASVTSTPSVSGTLTSSSSTSNLAASSDPNDIHNQCIYQQKEVMTVIRLLKAWQTASDELQPQDVVPEEPPLWKQIFEGNRYFLSNPKVTVQQVVDFSWFFFACIIKSMVVYANKVKKDDITKTRREDSIFPPTFYNTLKTFISLMAILALQLQANIQSDLVQQLAYFIASLYTLADRGQVTELIVVFLVHFHPTNRQLMANFHGSLLNSIWKFWTVILNSEPWLAVSYLSGVPKLASGNTDASSSSGPSMSLDPSPPQQHSRVPLTVQATHDNYIYFLPHIFFSSLFDTVQWSQDLREQYQSKPSYTAALPKPFRIFREFLTRIDRYAYPSHISRQLIAEVHFQFLRAAMANVHLLSKTSKIELEERYECFFIIAWLLRNVDVLVFRHFLSDLNRNQYENLLTIINLSTEMFAANNLKDFLDKYSTESKTTGDRTTLRQIERFENPLEREQNRQSYLERRATYQRYEGRKPALAHSQINAATALATPRKTLISGGGQTLRKRTPVTSRLSVTQTAEEAAFINNPDRLSQTIAEIPIHSSTLSTSSSSSDDDDQSDDELVLGEMKVEDIANNLHHIAYTTFSAVLSELIVFITHPIALIDQKPEHAYIGDTNPFILLDQYYEKNPSDPIHDRFVINPSNADKLGKKYIMISTNEALGGFLPHFWKSIGLFFENLKSEENHLDLLCTAQYLLQMGGNFFVRDPNTMTTKIIQPILNCFKSPFPSVRSRSVLFIFNILCMNYIIAHNVAKPRFLLMLALNSYDASIGKEAEDTQDSLSLLSELTDKDPYLTPELRKMLKELASQLKSIFEETYSITKLAETDTDLKADMYWNLVKHNYHAPPIRIKQLEKLRNYQESVDCPDEAAVTQVIKCAILLDIVTAQYREKPDQVNVPFPQYLPVRSEFTSLNHGVMRALPSSGSTSTSSADSSPASSSPLRRLYGTSWLAWDVLLSQIIPTFELYTPEDLKAFVGDSETAEQITMSNEFTLANITTDLEKACQLLNKAMLWEFEIPVRKILIALYEAQNNLPKVSEAYSALVAESDGHRACIPGILNTPILSRVRIYFYRVLLIGKIFEAENGNEYILKVYNFQTIGDLKMQLVKKYKSRLKVEPVVIQNNVEPSKEEIAKNPNTPYILLTSVTPFFTPQEESDRLTDFSRVANISTFYFDSTYFATEKKPKNPGLHETYLRRTEFHTEDPLPFCTRRVLVPHTIDENGEIKRVGRNVKEFTPAQKSAIDIQLKVRDLRKLLNPFDERRVSVTIKGMLAVEVNGGPMTIFHCFLHEHGDSTSEEDKDLIRDTFKDFFAGCKECIDRMKTSNISPAFRQEMIDMYNKLTKECEDELGTIPPYAEPTLQQ